MRIVKTEQFGTFCFFSQDELDAQKFILEQDKPESKNFIMKTEQEEPSEPAKEKIPFSN
jgi:hypothetical protein